MIPTYQVFDFEIFNAFSLNRLYKWAFSSHGFAYICQYPFMEVTEELVDNLAKLARLEFDESEKEGSRRPAEDDCIRGKTK